MHLFSDILRPYNHMRLMWPFFRMLHAPSRSCFTYYMRLCDYNIIEYRGYRIIEPCVNHIIEPCVNHIIESCNYRIIEPCSYCIIEPCNNRIIEPCGYHIIEPCGYRIIKPGDCIIKPCDFIIEPFSYRIMEPCDFCIMDPWGFLNGAFWLQFRDTFSGLTIYLFICLYNKSNCIVSIFITYNYFCFYPFLFSNITTINILSIKSPHNFG